MDPRRLGLQRQGRGLRPSRDRAAVPCCNRFDAVLMDVGIPDMDGLTTTPRFGRWATTRAAVDHRAHVPGLSLAGDRRCARPPAWTTWQSRWAGAAHRCAGVHPRTQTAQGPMWAQRQLSVTPVPPPLGPKQACRSGTQTSRMTPRSPSIRHAGTAHNMLVSADGAGRISLSLSASSLRMPMLRQQGAAASGVGRANPEDAQTGGPYAARNLARRSAPPAHRRALFCRNAGLAHQPTECCGGAGVRRCASTDL